MVTVWCTTVLAAQLLIKGYKMLKKKKEMAFFTVQLALKTSSQATRSNKLKEAMQLNVIKSMNGGGATGNSKVTPTSEQRQI